MIPLVSRTTFIRFLTTGNKPGGWPRAVAVPGVLLSFLTFGVSHPYTVPFIAHTVSSRAEFQDEERDLILS